MMATFRGRWTARVEQDFEVEADSEGEARALLAEEMEPGRVVELLDLGIESIEEVGGDGRG